MMTTAFESVQSPLMFYGTDNIGLFIDGPNFWSSVRGCNAEVDYIKLLNHFAELGRLRTAVYATALREDGEPDPVHRLTDYLSYNGWRVLTKPVKTLPSGVLKGNMDIELALEIIRASEFCDHIVLFSGDSDFAALVNYLQQRGARVTVVSEMDQCGDELRRAADAYMPLSELLPHISREREKPATVRYSVIQ